MIATAEQGSPLSRKEYAAKYYAENREQVLARAAERYAKNPEGKRAESAAYRLANPEKTRAAAVKCYAKNREKRLAHAAEWRAANPDCHRAASAAWYAANRERALANRAAYCAANPDRVRTDNAAWRAENPERHAANNRSWQISNPEACAAARARRRALKLAAPGRGVTAADWRNVLAESLGICAYCNERKRLTLDHIESLASGGEHDIENIAAACKSCNSSKADTSLLVWMAKKAKTRALSKLS